MNREPGKESLALVLVRFSLPLILSGMLQQLYNWADAFIVGNVEGELALAAIGCDGNRHQFLYHGHDWVYHGIIHSLCAQIRQWRDR